VLGGDDATFFTEVDEGVIALGAHGAALQPYIHAGDLSLLG